MSKIVPPPDMGDGPNKGSQNSSIPGPSMMLFDDPYPGLRQAIIWMNVYYLPTIIALGLIGNLLSLVVFVATYLRRLSLSVYLAALAVCDSAFLIALLFRWLEFVGVPLVHTNGWCQMITYLSYVTSFLSAWLVVSFTVERYIAIVHPLRRPHMCTTKRAKMVVSGLSVFAMVAYAPILWTSVVVKAGRMSTCSSLAGNKKIYVVMAWADFVVTLIVPFIAIFVFNLRIAVRIASFYNKQETSRALAMMGRSSSVRLGNRAQVKVTKLLLIISSVFLVVNLPSYVMRVRFFVESFEGRRKRGSMLDPLLLQLFLHIFYLNFAINFLIYSLCSKQFRKALKRLGWQIKYKVTRYSSRLTYTCRGGSWDDTDRPDMRTFNGARLKHRLSDPREGVL